jgi:hypothetical protein
LRVDIDLQSGVCAIAACDSAQIAINSATTLILFLINNGQNIAGGPGHVGLFTDQKQSTKFLGVPGTADSRA